MVPGPPQGFHKFPLQGAFFYVPCRYTFRGILPSGAQGFVCSAYDEKCDKKVAIKKFKTPFGDPMFAKRVYREIKLMKCVKHKNIITFLDSFSPQQNLNDFSDVYVVTELMDADLSKVIKEHIEINDVLLSYIIYQICCGIHYLHSIGVIHRDLKPSNIGVNAARCEVKILDFGLARRKDVFSMSPYVTSRYYRAPEIVLGMNYEENVDIWSIGCIFAELVSGVPLFQGANLIDQWTKIILIMGTPNRIFMQKLESSVRSYVESLPPYDGVPLWKIFQDRLFPQSNNPVLQAPVARDLLSKMLVIDPDNRISVSEALQHEYLNQWFEEEDVRTTPGIHLDPSVNFTSEDPQEYKKLIFEEVVTRLP